MGSNDKTKSKHAPNTLVIRPAKQGGVSFEYVANPPGDTWLYRGNYCYLCRQQEDKLEAYVPSDEIGCLPDKLYRALKWDSTRRLLAYRNTLLDKVNMGLTVALVCILAFLIFLILNP